MFFEFWCVCEFEGGCFCGDYVYEWVVLLVGEYCGVDFFGEFGVVGEDEVGVWVVDGFVYC